jgi:gamma-carbonic anhydrase
MNKPLILPYRGEYNTKGISPTISPKAFIAPGAAIIGDVLIGEESGIWFGCVVRGDVNTIRIGARTNIQDGTMIHVTRKTGPTSIGSNVTVGHAALLHACTLEDACFIGMRATLMDGVVVETGGWVAAGALVTPGKRVLKGQLWMGSPAKYVRDLTPEEQAFIPVSAEHYARHATEYLTLKA